MSISVNNMKKRYGIYIYHIYIYVYHIYTYIYIHTHTIEYYSTIKKNKIMPFAAK